MKIEIIITADFIAYHRWAEAPPEVSYLRHRHRHVFKVRIGIPVGHGNREREFFIEQKRLKSYLLRSCEGMCMTLSCEQIAEKLLDNFDYYTWAEIWEDGENGARVER